MESGISDSNELQARVKQQMVSLSDEVFLLADYSKFGVQAFALFAPWSHIHHVITDGKTDANYLEQLRAMSVHVTQLDVEVTSIADSKEGMK